MCYNTTSGEIEQNATACSLSSIRWKENIRPIDAGLDAVLALNPILYDLRPAYGTAKDKPGFIAEEVELVLPHIVSYGKDGKPSGLDYPQFTAYLTKAIQELNAKVEQGTRSVEENWQWAAITLLLLWNIWLTRRRV